MAIGAVYGATLGPTVVLVYLMATTTEMDIVAVLLLPFVFPVGVMTDSILSLIRLKAHPFGLLFVLGVAVGFYGLIGAIIGNVRVKRRPRPGHCKKCGYDLTGNVSGVCPECGAEIVK